MFLINIKRRLIVNLGCVLMGLVIIGCSHPYSGQRTPLVRDSAMVVTAHPLASKVGQNILKKGGNAVDAAVAVQFALAVVYPSAGNIGGGGFMIIREKDGSINSLDFREKAPSEASRQMYQNEEGEALTDKSYYGHLAAGVPGTVDGMFKAYNKYGSLPFKELIQPAIDLAKNGFALTEKEAAKFNENIDLFKKYNENPPEYLIKKAREKGDTLQFPFLAKTLQRIRDNGRAGFYKGKTAGYIVNEMEEGGGIITGQDLADYQAKFRNPVTGKYKNYRIISMGPPSSGGIALVQLLKSVAPYNLDSMGHNTVPSIHLMTEAERWVYADRSKHLGDPDFYDVPRKALISDAYITQRMAHYDPDEASSSSAINPGKPKVVESRQTTHYSVVDKYGNAVSVTTTLNGAFGSKVFVDSAGFFLNNEMDDFSIKPGVPNAYGLVGGEANAIAPGKRMLSSMTPTIVEKDGELFMVVGTPGGATIITSVFQTILNVTSHGMNMQEAVNAGRVHHQWQPDVILSEWHAMSLDVYLKLLWKGHWVVPNGSIGRVDAIKVREDGTLEGGADPRGDDTAMGF